MSEDKLNIKDDDSPTTVSEEEESGSNSETVNKWYSISVLDPGGVARSLNLQIGDVIVFLDNEPINLTKDEFKEKLNEISKKSLFITLYRHNNFFSVFLGQKLKIDVTVVDETQSTEIQERLESATVPYRLGQRQFYIFENRGDGITDIRKMSKSLLAMVCPPLWLLQQQFFSQSAALSIVIVFCFVLNIYFGFMVFTLISIFFMKYQKAIVVNYMRVLGFNKKMTLAASSYKSAKDQVLKFFPDTVFKF